MCFSGIYYPYIQKEVGMKRFISGIFLCIVLIISLSNASAAEKTYLIGTGDVLEIAVWKDPDLSRKVVVPPDGIISFPLIDTIDVTNLSTADLKKVVTKKLSEFVPDATVTVMLVEINSLKAYVIGKVNSPGEFEINMETNVMQILAKAGGLTPFASDGNIKILRQKDNQITKIPFDYGEVEKGKNLEQNIILKPGDVVVVP
jgi:polysaccharide export outer membrane protein